MTEKKNNVPASAEAPRKKKDGVFGQYFRKSRSTKTAAEIAAEIERVMRSEEATSGTASAGERPVKSAAKKPGQPKAPQQKPAQAKAKNGQKGQGGQTGKSKPAEEQKPAAQKEQKASSAKGKAEGKPKQQPKAAAKNEPKKQTQPAAQNKPAKSEPAKKQPAAKGGSKKPAAAAQQPNRSARRGKKADGTRRPPLRIISLGGLGEIGKNLTVFETEQDILVVDCGSAFPDDDLPGVDLVIPDFTYLEKNAAKVRGIFITHGHEDHIGSLPFLLKQIKAPVYATALTIGLISGKLKEHGILNQCKLNTVKPGDTIPAGTTMSVEFVRVNHSIPDACAFAIRTPAGLIVHTGDFKVDFTPISGEPIDLVRFGELGSEGVLALLSDSTNAEKPGSTPSERIVGESFEKLFERAANKRIIIATFASNVHRIQQVVDTAVRFGRKVAVFGRSMVNVVAIAQELGYLTIPAGVLIDADNLKDYTDEEIVLITTGSQGEPMSALTRMSIGSHRNIKIGPNDCIIISATPIPGNEKSVGKVVNELMKLGADVIYERMYDVHVSGHACQDETRLLLSLTQPRFFMPMHGEYKHLMKNAGVGASMGIPADIKKAAHAIANSMPLPLDVGKFDDSYFTYVASFGAFTAASYNAPQDVKNVFGHAAYVFEGIKDLGSIKPYHVKLVADGRELSGEYVFGAVANSTSFGGIVRLKDELVSLNDGMFEVLLIKMPKMLGDLSTIINSLTNSRFDNDRFEFFKASELVVTPAEPTAWSLDGEYKRTEGAVHIRNLHGAVNFIK